jgi:dihydropteroate synthase
MRLVTVPVRETSLDCRGRKLTFGRETLVMGILNVTPDSFSDGGRYSDLEGATARAVEMAAEGAAILDIGGQSTRPGFTEIPAEEEIARVVPVIERAASRVKIPISVDTYKPQVARAALSAGAHLLNDVYGLQRDPQIAQLALEFSCPVVVMHQEAGFKDSVEDPIEMMKRFFDRSLQIAKQVGVHESNLILDPGIGFQKTQQQNLAVVARLDELRTWGFPVLLGASRKSFIGNVLGGLPADQRLEGTLATTALAAWHGVEIVRVHDVAANLRVTKMISALRSAHS